MTELTKCNIWISNEIREQLLKLNYFLFENRIDFTNIEKGKQFYHQFGEMPDKIINNPDASVGVLNPPHE